MKTNRLRGLIYDLQSFAEILRLAWSYTLDHEPMQAYKIKRALQWVAFYGCAIGMFIGAALVSLGIGTLNYPCMIYGGMCVGAFLAGMARVLRVMM